jgi:hypothetical protein
MENRITVNLNEYHGQMFERLYTKARARNPTLTRSSFFLSMLEDKNAHDLDPRDGRKVLARLENKSELQIQLMRRLIELLSPYDGCTDPPSFTVEEIRTLMAD